MARFGARIRLHCDPLKGDNDGDPKVLGEYAAKMGIDWDSRLWYYMVHSGESCTASMECDTHSSKK